MSHLHYYRAMERAGWMRPIRTRGDLQQHVPDCEADPAGTPFGYILSMECADAVLDPDNIREWHEHGLRAIGITHYGREPLRRRHAQRGRAGGRGAAAACATSRSSASRST